MSEQDSRALSRLAGTPPNSCPQCGSEHVHRSHRRAALDYVLHAIGAEIRRCRDCRCRHAAFAAFSLPLGEPHNPARRWTERLVMASGFAAGLLLVWWIIRRFTELPG